MNPGGTGPTVGSGGWTYGPIADPAMRRLALFSGAGVLAGVLTIVLTLAGVDEFSPIPITAVLVLFLVGGTVGYARSIPTRVSVGDAGLARHSAFGGWQMPWAQVEAMVLVRRSVPMLVVVPRLGAGQRPSTNFWMRPVTDYWMRKHGFPAHARSTPLPDDARQAIEARFRAPLPQRAAAAHPDRFGRDGGDFDRLRTVK